MTTSKSYDKLNRLLSVSSAPSAASALSSGYLYNEANQRTRRTEADGSYWSYEYDSLGQVKSGKKYWSDGTPVAGQQFEYGFDDIGNRRTAKAGGDESGAGLRSASYTVNNLNQITQRTVPGTFDVIGAATAVATNVSVNNALAYRRGEYYRKELSVNNASAAVWQPVTNKAIQSGTTLTVTGNVFTAQSPESMAYDADGNLTNDGRWAYTWDAENRLIRMVARSTLPPAAHKTLVFECDPQGRRIAKRVWNNTNGTGSPVLSERYLYDGWNLVSVLNGTNNALIKSFLWGSDLSGTMQGAGGVGGLLAMNVAGGSVYFAAYDGNGNVTALVNGGDGTTAAQYEYGPFGEVIRCSGTVAKTNPFRFSTKYQDDETDLLYYGYRSYNSSLGRWFSRDPLGEPGFEVLRVKRPSLLAGGPNRHLFVQNNPVSIVDPLGLWQWGWPPWGKRKDEKCCKNEDATPFKDLADRFLTDLASKVQESEAEIGRAKVADILDKLGKAKFAIGSIKSVCDAKSFEDCDDFLKSGEIVDCMLCCTSIHALFSEELAGLGFSVTCKLACKNAN